MDPEADPEPIEKPKKVLSEKQKENLAKGRAVKRNKIAQDVEEKANKKLEARFDRLLELFDRVQMPEPVVQQKIKAKRAPPPRVEYEDESEEEAPEPPKRIEKPRAVVQVQADKKISFSFK